MSCEELYPGDPGIACDMTWTHGSSHGNTSAGVFWETSRPVPPAVERARTIAEIKRKVKKSKN